MDDLTLCGWRVTTEWPLPELLPWTGDGRSADITIRRGTVPDRLPGTVQVTPLVQVNDQGWLRYTIEGVADYLVRDGRDVIVDTRHPLGTPDVALFLLGSVFGFLCHQRGLFPLHASCVTFGETAMAFIGASGVGKSTIAAILMAHGARLVSDDVTVIDLHADGGPLVLPSFPRQKLWRDTLDILGVQAGRRLRRTIDLDKYDRPVADLFHAAPMKLRGLYQLQSRSLEAAPGLTPLTGLEAMRMLHGNIYRTRAADLLGLAARQLQDCLHLSKAVPSQALMVPDGVAALMQAVGSLDGLLRQAA